MRFECRVMVAAVCAGLIAQSVAAHAKPLPNKPQKQLSAQKRVDANKREPQAQAVRPVTRVDLRARPVLRPTQPMRPRDARSAQRDGGALRSVTPSWQMSAKPTLGSSALIVEARKYLGTNPTTLSSRWCARFMNLVLNKAGYAGTNSDAARSFASYGRRVSEPRVGAIAVLSRGRNQALGHVGIVTGIDPRGNPIIISGNHGRRVGEGVYPRNRVIAYVVPAEQPQVARSTAGAMSDAERDGIASPIEELLAAINSEKPRDPRQMQQQAAAVAPPAPPPQAAAPARAVAQAPEPPPVRSRVVEQMTQPQQVFYAQPPQPVAPRAAPATGRRLRPGEVDPALAKLLGLKANDRR